MPMRNALLCIRLKPEPRFMCLFAVEARNLHAAATTTSAAAPATGPTVRLVSLTKWNATANLTYLGVRKCKCMT